MRPAANPFATPFEILPSGMSKAHSIYCVSYLINLWVSYSTVLLGFGNRPLPSSVLLVIPVFENLSTNQNPIRRACILSIFLSAVIYSIWLTTSLTFFGTRGSRDFREISRIR